jgi:hypothetical protein
MKDRPVWYNKTLMLGCFKLFDILCISRRELYAIEKVLDINLAGYIYDYVTSVEEAGVRYNSDIEAIQLCKVIDEIRSTIWPTVLKYTFHLRKFNEYKSFCDSMSESLWIDSSKVASMLEKIDEILDSRGQWITEIPTRTREDYTDFMDTMKLFSNRIIHTVQNVLRDPKTMTISEDAEFKYPYSTNLYAELQNYSHKFYSSKDKKVMTKVSYLKMREPDLLAAKEGLSFKRDSGSVSIEKLWKFV